ncbi:MAG TPA: TolC family protein [Candidatus Eisenbacteria bacterium]|nr:TolC family protein [Candidatus Eisenbacteria bacterium]
MALTLGLLSIATHAALAQAPAGSAAADTSGLAAPPPVPGAERWTLARCIATALERSGDARAAHARTVQARGSALRAWSGILPTVSTEVSYSQTRPDKRSAVRGFADADANAPPDTLLLAPKSEFYSVGGSASMNILSIPAITEKRRQDLLKGGAQHGEAEARNAVAFTVKQRYFELVKAIHLSQVSRESERLARDEETRSEALFTVGTVARGDVLKARARRAQTQLDRISATNQVEIARSKLAQSIGVDPGTAIDIEESLNENVAVPDSLAAIRTALQVRPGLSQSASAERAARAGLFGAKAVRLPRVTANVSVDRSKVIDQLEFDPGSVAFEDERYATRWQGSVALSLPIFDGLAIEGNTRSAKGALLEAEANRRQEELDVAVEVQQAWLGLREAVERIAVAKEGLASAEEDYKFSKGRYELGAGTILDLLNAEVSLEQARRSHVDALVDAKVAEADLERAIGERRY